MQLLLKQKFWLILLPFLIFGVSSAQTPDQLRQEISDKQKTLDQVASEIQGLQQEINRVKKQAASLKNEIAIYDLQIRQTEAQIRAVQLEIEKLNTEVATTQRQIQEKTEQVERQKEFLSETLRLINEYDSLSTLEMTIGNDTFSEFLDQVTYASNLQEKTQELLSEIKRLKAELEEKKIQLVTELAKQDESRQKFELANQALEEHRTQRQEILTATRGQERVYQSLLTDAAQKQEQIEREIYETEIELRQKIGDKTLPPIHGLLRWPMSGILTQGYGKTGFTALGYSFHNGLDIAAAAGTSIYASGDGLVYATELSNAAYGNWVVLKHTLAKDGQVFNIYTLYAHMRRIAVNTGQAVRAGDILGYEGNTGNTTRLLYGPERGYHLHFTVFDEDGFGIKGGAYQHIYGPYSLPYGYTYNPMDFLR